MFTKLNFMRIRLTSFKKYYGETTEMTWNPIMIRQQGRVFYYNLAPKAFGYLEIQHEAYRRSLKVTDCWKFDRHSVMWKIEQINQKFMKGTKYEIAEPLA